MADLLQSETPKFITADLCPPNSPDLNPVHYRLWDNIQDCVYHTSVRDMTDLKKRLTDTWNGLSQSIVDHAGDEWRKGPSLGPAWKKRGDILNICCNNWTWSHLVMQLNLFHFRLWNNTPNVLSLHVSLCTWLISQGSVATVSSRGE